MLTNSYYRRIVVFCAVLMLLIAGLSIALYNNGPRVRFVQFSEDIAAASLTRGSTITINFDRPIEQKDYSEFVTTEPTVPFDVTTNTQGITLSLQENLQQNTTYSIQVEPEVYDETGKKMQAPYSHSFSTALPSYVYIERNYGDDEQQSQAGADDHIKTGSIGQESEIVFSHPEIRAFAANRDYIVITASEESEDAMFIVDRTTNETRQVDPSVNGRINNLTLGQRGQVALFTVRPDLDTVSNEFYELYANRVQALDLATDEVWALSDIVGDFIKAITIDIDNDGQVALIQDETLTFYAVSPFNDFDPVLIGSYDKTFGFNDVASEIIFRNREEFFRYSVANSETEPVGIKTDGFIQKLSAQNNGILASTTVYVGGRPQNQIDQYADWTENPTQAWRNETSDRRTLRGFQESHDGSLLAIQLNPELCQYDSIGTNSQCKTTTTTLFNAASQEVIAEFPGFNLIWTP